jgi:hypothetical protein
MPLNGSVAPLELLNFLTNAEAREADTLRQDEHGRVPRDRNLSDASSELAGQGARSFSQNDRMGESGEESVQVPSRSTITSGPDPSISFTEKQLHGRPTLAREMSEDDEWGFPARVTAPVITPSLLPLFPPQTPGELIAPAAASAARQGAKQDEAAARGEDLSMLAAQIKRILDEEARRHGIDV